MNPAVAGFFAGCLFIVGCSVAALVSLAAAQRRRERARCQARHPAGRDMPDDFRAWLAEVIAEVEAERIDDEWARISRAVGDE